MQSIVILMNFADKLYNAMLKVYSFTIETQATIINNIK